MLEAASFSYVDLKPAAVEEWFTLVQTQGVDLSMVPQWFSSTVEARGDEKSAGIFTVLNQGRLVGVVPYVQRHESLLGIRARSRELPGSYLVAYHPDIVSSIDIGMVLERFIADCSRSCDVLVIPNVEQGGSTWLATFDVAGRLGLPLLARTGHISPYLKIDTTWEQFVAAKPKKFRYKLRSALKMLHSAGTPNNRWFETAEETRDLLVEIHHIEANSWKASQGMAIIDSEMERAYYAKLLPFLASQSALHANVLYLDSVPIAYSLCYLSHGCVRQLKTSFDQRFEELSPGSIVHRFAIEKAFGIRAREFDFLGDAMLHKTHWATGLREHVSIQIFLPTIRGRMLYNARRLADAGRRVLERRDAEKVT